MRWSLNIFFIFLEGEAIAHNQSIRKAASDIQDKTAEINKKLEEFKSLAEEQK